jgi:hypothetical protein
MEGEHCRLYDEQLLKSIMVSTGLSVMDFLKVKAPYDEEEVCRYIENNADKIIDRTIDGLDNSGPCAEDDSGSSSDRGG